MARSGRYRLPSPARRQVPVAMRSAYGAGDMRTLGKVAGFR